MGCKICKDLLGFCESGLSMTRLGELLSSFVTWGSTRSRPLKLAYLTGLETLHYMSNKQEYPTKKKCNWIIHE